MSWSIKLADLDPEFLKFENMDTKVFKSHPSISGADGIRFVCPKCFLGNGRSVAGVHSVICWQPHIPQNIYPSPGRWQLIGSSLDDVSLAAGSSSVGISSGCRAHFFVRAGNVVNAD